MEERQPCVIQTGSNEEMAMEQNLLNNEAPTNYCEKLPLPKVKLLMHKRFEERSYSRATRKYNREFESCYLNVSQICIQ